LTSAWSPSLAALISPPKPRRGGGWLGCVMSSCPRGT
jgi:hypothetical protein